MGFFARLMSRGRPTVSVLRLTGPIGAGDRFRPSLNLAGVAGLLQDAFNQPGLKAVALIINSPGGSPVQSALIMRRVRDLAREKDVPVLAFTEDVAASGGYMLALAADEIFVHEASIIGSIGVLSASFGFAEAIGKLGIERRLYTAGEAKARLDAFSPAKPEDVAWLKNLQEQIHDYFRKVVEERRGRRLKSDHEGLYSGDIWIGAQAVELGLVDGIGEVRSILRQRFGKKVRLKVISKRRGILSGILGKTRGREMDFDAASGGFAQDLLATIEARLMWNRFGL